MRSYDWRMPEEKYRTISDHLADVIYAYVDEYKEQGVREGLNPDSIVVVGNPIVDILNYYYFSRKDRYDSCRRPILRKPGHSQKRILFHDMSSARKPQ